MSLWKRRPRRFSTAALESALAEALRSITALEARTERLEKSLTAARAIARSGDEVPAWIELARRVPLGSAVFERAVDPRAVLALLTHAEGLPEGTAVLILADDATGSIASRALLAARPDLRPVIITSSDTAAMRDLADDPRIELRRGEVTVRSFGDIAGPWYRPEDLTGLTGVPLVLVAGPSHAHGPAARHAVAAGVGELTDRAVLVVARPADGPVARAVKLWGSTSQQTLAVTALSPWEIELTAARSS